MACGAGARHTRPAPGSVSKRRSTLRLTPRRIAADGRRRWNWIGAPSTYPADVPGSQRLVALAPAGAAKGARLVQVRDRAFVVVEQRAARTLVARIHHRIGPVGVIQAGDVAVLVQEHALDVIAASAAAASVLPREARVERHVRFRIRRRVPGDAQRRAA